MATQTLLFAELAPDPLLSFPEPLSERYRPQRIADFAGLTEAKKVLAGFAARPTNAGFVFVGTAGTGKTSMAFALAREIGGFVHHIKAGRCTVEAVRDVAYSCWYVPPAGFKRHIIVIDEADLMSGAAQGNTAPSAHELRKLLFKSFNFWTLRHHSAAQYAIDRCALFVTDNWTGCWNHLALFSASCSIVNLVFYRLRLGNYSATNSFSPT